MDLQGRSALVTGGAGGFGEASVRRLISLGMRAVVFDQDADKAGALAKELGDDALAFGGSVLEDDDVLGAIETAKSLGPLSVVVNIAGGGTGGGRTVGRDGTPHDKDVFVSTLELNAVSTFNVSRLAAAAMGENEPDEEGSRGVIINTGSLAGIEGKTGQLAYGAAKAAVLGMTLPLARDLSILGIRVCAIAPGVMGTPPMLQAMEFLKHDPADGVLHPQRMGYPDEYALLVEMIVRNGYLNGENIRLDGGLRFSAK